MRHSLQEIRYEHSFQVRHTSAVVSAATATQPSAGNATETTAMSAPVMVVHLVVLVVVVLLMVVQLRGVWITRGVGGGICCRLCRDQ